MCRDRTAKVKNGHEIHLAGIARRARRPNSEIRTGRRRLLSRTDSRLHEAHVGAAKLLGRTGARFAQNVSARREMHHCLHALESARQIRRTDVLSAEGNDVITERTQGWAKMPTDEARGAGYCDVA